MAGSQARAGKNAGAPTRARRASDRGRYGRLSRERVLASALELVDRDGLSALSMRRLGAELGVEAMALYRYAAGKDALLDGLVEALHLELEERLAADSAAADWRAELGRIARATYDVCLAHPQVVPLLSTRMLAVPLARRPLATLRHHERVVALLEEAGLGTDRSAVVFRAFTAWVLGYVSVELQAMVDNPEERPRLPARPAPHAAPGAAPAARERSRPGRTGRS